MELRVGPGLNVRPEFARAVANKLVPGNVTQPFVDAVKDKISSTGTSIRSKADDEVEINFERVAKVITGASDESPSALKEQAGAAVKAFGNTFIFGFGSMMNKNFESHGDGIFSFEGGNKARGSQDLTFMVDTTPGQDNMQYMTISNTILKRANSGLE